MGKGDTQAREEKKHLIIGCHRIIGGSQDEKRLFVLFFDAQFIPTLHLPRSNVNLNPTPEC